MRVLSPLLLIASVLVAPLSGSAESAAVDRGPAVLRDGTRHQALFAVAFDNDAGVAVGASGAVLESSDGGQHWQPIPKAVTPLALLAVDVRGTKRLAVGQRGVVLRKEGAGAWVASSAGTDERLFGVSENATGLAVAVGSFGTVMKSTDGGQNWQKLTVDWAPFAEAGTEPHLYAVKVDDAGTITMGGEFGLILRSGDGGGTWKALHKGDASVLAIELRVDGVGYAVGQNGSILRSKDGGATWDSVNAGTKAILLGVRSAAGSVYVTGMRNMLVSSDDGATWRAVTGGDFSVAWYAGVAASPSKKGVIAVGQAGRVLGIGL
jgi:photosystem II stability/assembly factor-like uncharacterized protein